MRILVVGNGAREHALAWKLRQSPRIEALFVAPGNAGTAAIAENLPVGVGDLDGLAEAAERQRIDLTIVGPEAPLAAGIVDHFQARGLTIAGPTAEAARIESSKVWAKEIMAAASVPTGASRTFTDLTAALDLVADAPLPMVIKASGLAAGKGVIIAETRAEAEQVVRELLEQGKLGDAGNEILIEEFLEGREVSLLALTDGETTYPLLPACDYKRADDGDRGANTGGMGAYAPAGVADAGWTERIMATIIEPTLAELRARGIVYRGVLYAGVILTAEGPKVLEFNCRMGDPETEVILPLLASDLVTLFEAVARGSLGAVPPPSWHSGGCVGVVLASGGYPGSYQTGYPIEGLERLPEDVVAFHAGTDSDDGRIVTHGGRVLTLVARGPDLAAARGRVYDVVPSIHFEHQHYRRDIAARETET